MKTFTKKIMSPLSYNEEARQHSALIHVFWPGRNYIIGEAIVGVVALIFFNLSWLSSDFLSQGEGNLNPFAPLSHIWKKIPDSLGNHQTIQQVLLFALWMIVGALIYIALFRVLRILFGVKESVNTGVRFIREDHERGFIRWLASLHDFFVWTLIVVGGGIAILLGTSICFGVASQELNNGLSSTFPSNVGDLLFSLVAVALSVRCVMAGLSLLSSHFRAWYSG